MALDIGSLVEFEDKPTAKAATTFDIGSMVEYDDSKEVKQRASTVTGIATQYNPEQIANSRNLGRQVGIPDDVAERNPEAVRRKFISQKVEQLYDNSPVTGRKLADPAFAKIAHDLTDEMAGQESAIKQLALTKQGFRAASELSRAMSDQKFSQHVESARSANIERSISDVALGFGRSVVAGVAPRVGQGVYGALASPFGALAPLLDWTAGTILPANPLRVAEQGLLDLSKQQASIAEFVAGDKTEQGFVERAVNSGFESMGMNLPPLLAGVISNNPALALNAMVSLTGGQEYAKAREQGLNANQALVYAGSQTAVEWATEKLPVETLFKGLRENTGLLKTVLLTNVQEQLGEQAATVLQDLNEWAVLNPDKPFNAYLAERPDAALQTAIATLVGTTGQVAIAKSIEAAGNYVSTEQEKIQYQSDSANQTLQAFANIQQLAEQSKLKQRSSQDFATFLQEAGGENGIDEVFIDARTFEQEAIAQGVDLNVLLQSSPAINQQLQDAIAQGVDLIIPVGEFGSAIAGTDFGNVLLPHLRADENGISAFEAKNQLDGAMEALQLEAAQVSDKYVNDQAWQASLSEVGDNLLNQLNTVGRFAPEHNQAYVNGLVAPWYSTLANELGVTPSEAFARYPLRVSDQANAQGFEQGYMALNDVIKSWDSVGIKSFVSEKNGVINISQIIVPEESRGNGIGSKAIQDLVDYADSTNQRITLTPSTDYGATSKKRLTNFYKRFGFIENKGNNRDFSTMEGMYRVPNDANILNQGIDEYGMEHRPPGPDNGAPLHDVTGGGDFYPADFYSPKGLQYYGTGDDAVDRESFAQIRAAHDKPNAKVKMYRAVPKILSNSDKLALLDKQMSAYMKRGAVPKNAGLQGSEWYDAAYDERAKLRELKDDKSVDINAINSGDWVTLSKTYAKEHGESHLNGEYKILTKTVKASELFTNGDSINEFGYWAESSNVYNQDKSDNNARGQISFGNDITQGANIALLKTADASTFIHELGHFFLEVYSDIASKPDAPQKIVDDMNALLEWFGIESTEQPALDVWRNMSIEQKRAYHEKLARGFEQFTFEGNAPSLALAKVFSKLRSFMLSAYKSLKKFFERSGDPALSPEVRMIFERMLASDEAIAQAQAVRGMLPMFASMQDAGMSVDEYADYLNDNQDATDQAKTELTQRALRDLQWLRGARNKVLRGLQKQAREQRQVVRMAVRRDVMTQPIYQAYAWLKQTPNETKAQQAEKIKATQGVDTEHDSLFTAIAKLGGLNRDLATSELGIDPADKQASGVFGKPVLRKEGGLSVDGMAEALAQYGYLTQDEHGKWDLHEFEDKFFEESRGDKQFSVDAEGAMLRQWQQQLYDQAQLDAAGKGKFNLEIMQGLYTDDAWRKLGIGRSGMVMSEGYHPDAVAELFGFNSGDSLVQSLINAQAPKDLIEDMTDKAMLEQFGDLIDDKRMQAAADKAVHNDIRARVLATELAAQNKALGNRRVLEAAAKEYANKQISKTLVRDLKPVKYTRAESKAAKMADKAMRKGDTQTVVQAKRDQLLNNRAVKATMEANDKVEVTLKYLKKFDSEGVRKNLDIEYIEQIYDVLNRFDLRSGQSLRAIGKRKSLLQWVESQKELGLSPVIDEDLLNEARRTSYKDLPFEQFLALADSIRNIEHLGRLKKTLLTAKDKREFAERMAEARESINGNGNRIIPERATPNDFIGKSSKWGRRMAAAHRKFSSFIRELDGGKDLGVMADMLLYSMYEAGSLETDLRAQATEDMQRLFATIEGSMDKSIGNLYAIKRLVPNTNISLTHEQRIMFAMNWGNEGNQQRLLDGGLEGSRSISNEDASAILDTITKDEWDFIQGTWDYIATFKPMIAEQERKLTGREPVWIDATPVNTKFGVYAGGYFPAKYDAQMSTRSESLEAVTDLRMAMKGAFNASGTRDGYTQARAEAVKGRPILLSFDTISRHIHEVTHRLAWQEWLTDATRVVTALDGSIRERLGAEALQEIHQHIRDVATGDAPVTGTTDVLLSRIRTGTSIVGMGYRVSTALLQPSGIFQSWGRLGINAVANGVKAVVKNPVKTHDWIMENSPMMRNRAKTLNREINEIVNQVRAGKALTNLQASYFYMISKMQMLIDMPTYMGAYEKALVDLDYDQAGSEDERKAIETKAHSFAGQTVIDTQTGGEIKDLAGVQKGSQGQKLFTNFYSYFSALYNLNVENYRTKKLTNPTEFADFVATALLLNVMPVIYSVALKNLLKGECAWDDTECLISRFKSEQMSTIFGQMIGVRDLGIAVDVATGGDAYGYSGPPSLKFFSEIYKFGQQSNQGDIDMPLFKSLNNAAGILFHYPAGQINSTVDGMLAIERGEVEGVSIFGALISGPPKD